MKWTDLTVLDLLKLFNKLLRNNWLELRSLIRRERVTTVKLKWKCSNLADFVNRNIYGCFKASLTTSNFKVWTNLLRDRPYMRSSKLTIPDLPPPPPPPPFWPFLLSASSKMAIILQPPPPEWWCHLWTVFKNNIQDSYILFHLELIRSISALVHNFVWL